MSDSKEQAEHAATILDEIGDNDWTVQVLIAKAQALALTSIALSLAEKDQP